MPHPRPQIGLAAPGSIYIGYVYFAPGPWGRLGDLPVLAAAVQTQQVRGLVVGRCSHESRSRVSPPPRPGDGNAGHPPGRHRLEDLSLEGLARCTVAARVDAGKSGFACACCFWAAAGSIRFPLSPHPLCFSRTSGVTRSSPAGASSSSSIWRTRSTSRRCVSATPGAHR